MKADLEKEKGAKEKLEEIVVDTKKECDRLRKDHMSTAEALE